MIVDRDTTDITLIDNEYATLTIHVADKIVHHAFHRPVSGEAFRNVLLTGAEALQKYGATRWLSDNRKIGAMSQEDTDWGMSVWFPVSKKAAWKYWALLVPADLMARMNMKEFVDTYFERGIRIMVFVDFEDAYQWLKTIDD